MEITDREILVSLSTSMSVVKEDIHELKKDVKTMATNYTTITVLCAGRPESCSEKFFTRREGKAAGGILAGMITLATIILAYLGIKV